MGKNQVAGRLGGELPSEVEDPRQVEAQVSSGPNGA